MAAKPNTDDKDGDAAAPKPGRKKLLIVVIAVVLLLVAGGGGAFFYLKKMRAAADEDGAPAEKAEAHKKDAAPPQFMPLENLVVNLADDGGTRYVQMGITLQLADSKTADRVKGFMPAVRNGFLLLLAGQSADDLLQAEGKIRVQNAMLTIVREQTGLTEPAPANPIQAVLFSSLIVQ